MNLISTKLKLKLILLIELVTLRLIVQYIFIRVFIDCLYFIDFRISVFVKTVKGKPYYDNNIRISLASDVRFIVGFIRDGMNLFFFLFEITRQKYWIYSLWVFKLEKLVYIFTLVWVDNYDRRRVIIVINNNSY